jgi:uncharacterized protein
VSDGDINVADDAAEDVDDELEDDGFDEDDDFDDEDEDDDDYGNRIVGGRARSVLHYLAENLVDDTDAIEIEMDESRQGVMLRLHVGPDDMGRVIGRRGRVAQAVRAIVGAAGESEGIRASVDIVE